MKSRRFDFFTQHFSNESRVFFVTFDFKHCIFQLRVHGDEVTFDSSNLFAVHYRTHPTQLTKACLNAAKSHNILWMLKIYQVKHNLIFV